MTSVNDSLSSKSCQIPLGLALPLLTKTLARLIGQTSGSAGAYIDEAVSLLGYLFQKVPDSVKHRYEDVTGDVLKTAQAESLARLSSVQSPKRFHDYIVLLVLLMLYYLTAFLF